MPFWMLVLLRSWYLTVPSTMFDPVIVIARRPRASVGPFLRRRSPGVGRMQDEQADEPRDDHRDVRHARDLLEHPEAAPERLDRGDVAEPGARQRREAQKEELDPRALALRVDGRG